MNGKESFGDYEKDEFAWAIQFDPKPIVKLQVVFTEKLPEGSDGYLDYSSKHGMASTLASFI